MIETDAALLPIARALAMLLIASAGFGTFRWLAVGGAGPADLILVPVPMMLSCKGWTGRT